MISPTLINGENAAFHNLFRKLPAVAELMKIPLSLHITLTAMVGYLLSSPVFSMDLIRLSLAVFLLSTGSATLNNVQDRFLDSKFKRTRNRAIPSGRIKPRTAVLQGTVFLLLGWATLFRHAATITPWLLGLAAVILYNLVYTRLKAKTVYAILPGTICGMLAPYIGWAYGGGSLIAPEILLLGLIIGVWQIPHYWIILIKYRQEYQNQRKVPVFLDWFHISGLKRAAFVWIAAFSCLTLLPILYGMTATTIMSTLLIVNAAVLVLGAFIMLFRATPTAHRLLHIHLSLALTASLCAVVIEKAI